MGERQLRRGHHSDWTADAVSRWIDQTGSPENPQRPPHDLPVQEVDCTFQGIGRAAAQLHSYAVGAAWTEQDFHHWRGRHHDFFALAGEHPAEWSHSDS